MFPVKGINKVPQKPNNTQDLLGHLKSKIFLTVKILSSLYHPGCIKSAVVSGSSSNLLPSFNNRPCILPVFPCLYALKIIPPCSNPPKFMLQPNHENI